MHSLANYIMYNDFSVEYVGFSIQVILSNTNNDSFVSFCPIPLPYTIQLTCSPRPHAFWSFM